MTLTKRAFAYTADLDADYGNETGETKICPESEANLEISLAVPQTNPNVLIHKPQMDLDVPHSYRPSSTPGNGHLSIDVDVPWEKYLQWLRLSAEIGIIQHGWVKFSEQRGFTSLRKPEVKKKKPSAYNLEPTYPEPALTGKYDDFKLLPF